MRTCPFAGCGQRIAPNQFACRPHWFSLGDQERAEIWRAFRLWLNGRIDGDELRRRQQAVLGTRGRAEEVRA